MPAFFVSLKRLEIYHLRNLLESEGISCFIRNEQLSQLAGEIPFIECSMKVWLQNETDKPRARQVLREFLSAPYAKPVWRCQCGEDVEGQFTSCWFCGAERPEN